MKNYKNKFLETGKTIRKFNLHIFLVLLYMRWYNLIKRYIKNENATYYMYIKSRGEIVMGVSMGVIKPIKGSAAQKLIKESKRNSVDGKVIEDCKKLSSIIRKR